MIKDLKVNNCLIDKILCYFGIKKLWLNFLLIKIQIIVWKWGPIEAFLFKNGTIIIFFNVFWYKDKKIQHFEMI